MGDFFRSSSGVIIEIDVPDAGLRRERHDEQVANGELVAVAGTPRQVEVPGGGYRWELDDDAPAEPDPEPEGDEPAEDEGEAADGDEEPVDGDEPPDGNIDDVLDWVGDDPARARQALEVEQSESGKGRSSLIGTLTGIAEG